jgi:excisionase family DNA binding protein
LIPEDLLKTVRKVVREELLRATGHHFKNKYLGLKEVAGLLGVHQSTVCRWLKNGRLPKPFTRPWKQPRWQLKEILKCVRRD